MHYFELGIKIVDSGLVGGRLRGRGSLSRGIGWFCYYYYYSCITSMCSRLVMIDLLPVSFNSLVTSSQLNPFFYLPLLRCLAARAASPGSAFGLPVLLILGMGVVAVWRIRSGQRWCFFRHRGNREGQVGKLGE